jgi:hypothetical protein
MRLELELQRVIDASAEELWRVVGTRFQDIGVWASGIAASAPLHADVAGGDCPIGGRVCRAKMPLLGEIEERITHFDDAARTLSYVAATIPWLLRSAENTWSVEVVSPVTSRVRSTAILDFKQPVVGGLLWSPIKVALTLQGRTLLADLAHYVEHGEVSSAKLRSMGRAQQTRS